MDVAKNPTGKLLDLLTRMIYLWNSDKTASDTKQAGFGPKGSIIKY